MKRSLLMALMLALGILAACSPNPTQAPLEQLTQNDAALYDSEQALLDEAVNAFSDLMPQRVSPQAAAPRPLTMVKDREEIVLIGGPWRPPFPWPLVDKPLFITIKQPSPQCTPPSRCYPQARMAYLRQSPQGGYELEWFGAPGTPSVRVPAQVEQQGNLEGVDTAKVRVKISINPFEKEIDIIIVFGSNNDPNPARMHIVSSLPPDTLPGRPLNSTLDTGTYEAKFKDICCGRPKPFPPLWPPIWLQREDVSVVAVPYDNPKLRDSTPIEELVGENLGFLYLRKKPWLPGPTTDCGPANVWCPSEPDLFLNLRLVRDTAGGYAVQLTKLADPKQVIATLPAQVLPNDGPAGMGIEDNITSPEEPTLKIKWPKIKIIIIICKNCNVNIN
ncbi:hypothetical protein [Calidithermus timidus]|jgi:hypothetical protein|uniref:hypothetical protein n=1 Tax=Calidithermus timidus TaxID=307124 RepID=UPI000363FC66|nr:hypothetical protein [Calidithermus timidus]